MPFWQAIAHHGLYEYFGWVHVETAESVKYLMRG